MRRLASLYGRLQIRYKVARPIPYRRASSARSMPGVKNSVLSASTRSGDNFGFAPNLTPAAFATAIPSAARSLIKSRSNSPIAASMWNRNRPVGLVVSIDWSRTTRSTDFAWISFVICARSRTERARRSSLVMTSWSPSRMKPRASRRAVRSERLAPLFFSSKMRSQPWVLSLSSWTTSFCPVVETRAYQIFMCLESLRG